MRTPDPGGYRTAATWSRGRWATATPSQHRSPRPPTARSPAPAPGTSGSRSASSLSRTTRDGRARDECARLGSVAVWRWRDGAARRQLHSTARDQRSAPADIAGASKKSRCPAFVPTSSTSCAARKLDQTRRPEAPGRPVVRCCLNAAGSCWAKGHPRPPRTNKVVACAGKKLQGHSAALCCAHSGALEAASDSAASELRCFSGAPGRVGGAREPVWMRLDGGKLKGWEVVCGGYEGRL